MAKVHHKIIDRRRGEPLAYEAYKAARRRLLGVRQPLMSTPTKKILSQLMVGWEASSFLFISPPMPVPLEVSAVVSHMFDLIEVETMFLDLLDDVEVKLAMEDIVEMVAAPIEKAWDAQAAWDAELDAKEARSDALRYGRLPLCLGPGGEDGATQGWAPMGLIPQTEKTLQTAARGRPKGLALQMLRDFRAEFELLEADIGPTLSAPLRLSALSFLL